MEGLGFARTLAAGLFMCRALITSDCQRGENEYSSFRTKTDH